jgi:hypothetical protein
MSEKSGIQILENLCEQISLLNKRFEIIEQNTKELLQRSNGFSVKQKTIEKSIIEIPIEKQQEKPTIVSTSPMPKKKESTVENCAKIIGKLKTQDGKCITDVQITILDQKEQPVKSTKTNRAGEWIAFVPQGKYKIKYFLQNMVDATMEFNVKPDEKLIRLPQPKIG